jgi:hypothetical protein
VIILFDNLIDDSEITSLHASLNYPVENLQNSVLRKRYQCSEDVDTLTFIFSDSNSLVKDFWYAFTNAAYLQLRLYDHYGLLLHTITINYPDNDMETYHFTGVYAAYAELDIQGDEGVYLGGIGLGNAISFPDPEGKWNEPLTDNSIAVSSLGGQSKSEYIEPLRRYSFNFIDITREDLNYYIGLIKNLGKGKPVFMDLFENNHDFILPIYAKITAQPTPRKDGRNYEFDLPIEEAR